MKFLSLTTLRSLALCTAMAIGITATAQGKKEVFDPFSAGIEENVSTPAVQPKHSAAVAAAMGNLARTLRDAGYKVSKVRSGEVIMVTIPCSTLFAPNTTELKSTAAKTLRPLVPYVKRTDNYKIVIAVHADNTGDATYADAITADRANAVDAFFSTELNGVETPIIPYGIGMDEPVAPNTGVTNRAANRRVEIYFIPTQNFIDKARKK